VFKNIENCMLLTLYYVAYNLFLIVYLIFHLHAMSFSKAKLVNIIK